ncbi:bifunctional DedA family/phosphatase PAP2 family protein [Candidatus Nomurabacteria bacterium]|nr:bifunctional DedA family/phosphatase PAP2 family protein [Candidatus Kaiserbacteria bacterium]MCB9811068.1 bifunctional DedA family/phosphatase PAP2 family protein [Candidatus Nomurabacteria bacterium]MCB9814928.1 bifunctional DedA family/phosphatase PAP2 family protein [Candidatus Nomurabacteria bacterium]
MSFLEHISTFSFLGFNHWGYVLIFVASLLEAVPLLGLFSPGMVVIVAGGFMVKLGFLDLGDVIFVASLGAVTGDFVGYLLGKKYGVGLLEKYGKYFFFKKEQFESTKKIMHKHAGKSLIIGRFNSLTRALAPFVAGTTNIPFRKFMLFNIIGGVAWVTVFVLVGFIFGHSYEAMSKYIGRFVLVAVTVGIMIVYAYRFVDKRKHVFSKYHLYILIVNVCSLYLFSKMAEDVIDMESITKLDFWLNNEVTRYWSLHINEIVIFITNIASPLNLSFFALVLFGVLVYVKKWYFSILLATGMMGGVVLESLIKFLMHRERPLNMYINVDGYSFPSGHATMATIFFITLLFAFKDDLKNKFLRGLFIVSAVILFISVGLSRVYLNVHWFSDVIAGFSLGVFWLTLLVLIFKLIDNYAHDLLNKIKIKFSQWSGIDLLDS